MLTCKGVTCPSHMTSLAARKSSMGEGSADVEHGAVLVPAGGRCWSCNVHTNQFHRPLSPDALGLFLPGLSELVSARLASMQAQTTIRVCIAIARFTYI